MPTFLLSSSTHRPLPLSSACVLLATWVLLVVPSLQAAPVRGIRPAARTVIAPLGGVLMIPLTARRSGDNWPTSIPIRLSDGTTLEGQVILVTPARRNPAADRRWTASLLVPEIRPIQPTDDTTQPIGQPHLIARLPEAGVGDLRILGKRLPTSWESTSLDFPPLRDAAPAAPSLTRPPIHDSSLPDPHDPLEHWRWVLLALAQGQKPPPVTDFTEPASLVADHQAALWAIGLRRLASLDPAVASECLRLLTHRSIDEDENTLLATWIADSSQLRTLLTLLLDRGRRSDLLLEEARAWIAAQSSLLSWTAAESPSEIRLTLINRDPTPLDLDLTWIDAPAAKQSYRVLPARITRLVIPRPMTDATLSSTPGLIRPSPARRLRIQGALIDRTLTLSPAVNDIRPPGFFITGLRPALTLLDAELGRQIAFDATRATTAHVRHRAGRWEIFFDCRRPRIPSDDARTLPPM